MCEVVEVDTVEGYWGSVCVCGGEGETKELLCLMSGLSGLSDYSVWVWFEQKGGGGRRMRTANNRKVFAF